MKTLLVGLLLILSNLCLAQVPADDLFRSFRQGERNNCPSVALIKAGLNVYGINQLFTSDWAANGSVDVTLKNGKKLTLQAQEIQLGKAASGFTLIDTTEADYQEMLDYAQFAYAVMAKNMQGIDTLANYEAALEKLGNGGHTPTIYQYLGFENGKHIRHLRRGSGKHNRGLVAWSANHAVFAAGGYMDLYGSKRKLWIKYSGRFLVVPV